MIKKDFGSGLLIAQDKRVVLGLDQSYTGFGVTAMDADDPDRFHSWLIKSVAERDTMRLLNIRTDLEKIRAEILGRGHQIVRSALEGYAMGAKNGREMAGELGGMVKIWAWENLQGSARDPYVVAPTALKKYVTGKGNGVSKNQMLLAIYKAWEVEFSDDNMADSYAIARIACGYADTQYRKDVIEKVGVIV